DTGVRTGVMAGHIAGSSSRAWGSGSEAHPGEARPARDRPPGACGVNSAPDRPYPEYPARRATGAMRLRRIRFTVRGMMVIVLAVGICLHLSFAAWRAHRSDFPHLHSAIVTTGGNPGKAVAVRDLPFWTAFLRHATGWSRGKGCFMGGKAMMEMC